MFSHRENNVLEQDHRFLERRIAVRLWFRSVDGALRTIAGYEAMNMIRKGQVRWLAKGDITGQVRYIEQAFGLRRMKSTARRISRAWTIRSHLRQVRLPA
jgi:hypothetical protein